MSRHLLALLAATLTWSAGSVCAQGGETEGAQPPEDGPIGLAPPRVELTVVGPNPAYLGQLVQLELALLRDNRTENPQAAFFGEPHVPGAIALLSGNSPPPEVRQQDDIAWLVQKRRYLVFPQTDGRLRVPPIEVRIPSAEGEDAVLQSEPVELHADVPRGAGGRAPLVARSVRLERRVEGDLDTLRVGDTFTVHTVLRAEQTDAVMLPAIDQPELEGLSRYPGEARTRNQAARGAYRAERSDRTTYVAETWGRYTLPRVAVLWLDPSTGQYHEAVAPALQFRARVNPSLGRGCVGGPAALARGAGWLLAFVALVFAARRGLVRLRARRRRQARVRSTQGEREAWAALQAQVRAGHDGATLTALYRWLHRALPGVSTLARLRAEDDDPDLHRATEALEGRVAAGADAGTARDLLPPLRRLRHAKRTGVHARSLPDLNESAAPEPDGPR